jgi:hypothetical protein
MIRQLGVGIAIGLLWLGLTACGGEGDDDDNGGGLGTLDARCEALCADSEPACDADVAACEPVCQVRVAGMAPLCATCLIEGANNGACGGGGPCCPDPDFPNSVLDCASSCGDSAGVNPSGDHPICTALCADDDPACSADSTQCFQQCQARIQGVSGLCALCLLEGASNGSCSPGQPCCPDPDFPTPVSACAAACGG